MSYYTNDIDTLRQMISQSLPNFIISGVTIITVLSIMLYFSVWMTLFILLGVFAMVMVTKVVGGRSSATLCDAAGHRQHRERGGGDDERPEGTLR